MFQRSPIDHIAVKLCAPAIRPEFVAIDGKDTPPMKTSTPKTRKTSQTAHATPAQPELVPGMRVYVATIDGAGPHFGEVMELGEYGVLVRIDADDEDYPGTPIAVELGKCHIVPRQHAAA